MHILLSPPLAFLAYILLVTALFGFGRALAPAARVSLEKSSIYAGGEVAAMAKAAPGYRRFFIVALFFAVLHLGALVLATAGLAGGAALAGSGLWIPLLLYVGGLSLTLLILLVS